MNKSKLKYWENYFLDKKQKITESSQKKAQEVLELEANDEMDLAQNITIEDMAKKLAERNHIMLFRINNALKKINDGSFGLCEECEEEIIENRLKVLPDCRLCINCAENQEKIKKQYRFIR